MFIRAWATTGAGDKLAGWLQSPIPLWVEGGTSQSYRGTNDWPLPRPGAAGTTAAHWDQAEERWRAAAILMGGGGHSLAAGNDASIVLAPVHYLQRRKTISGGAAAGEEYGKRL